MSDSLPRNNHFIKAGAQIEKKLLSIQIKEDIENKIRTNVLKPGDKLPSEPELAKKYKISRSTLREALKMLQKEWTILSINGVGTYVNERAKVIENPLNKLQSLGEMIKNAGYRESESEVVMHQQDPEPEWKEKLLIDEPVLVIERTRIADHLKVAFYYNIIASRFAGNTTDIEFKDSIFTFMEDRAGIRISHCITEIVAISRMNKMDRHAIQVLGSEIVKLKQLHFDTANRPVLYSIDYLKSEFIKLVVYRER